MRSPPFQSPFLFLSSASFLVLAAGTVGSQAACDNFSPATGATATCGADATPVTSGVHAQPGSSNVTINIDAGATLNVLRANENSAASVIDDSEINNNGTVSLTGAGSTGGNRGAALLGLGNGNDITNNGAVSTTGQFNDGMAADGSGNTLINNGTITTTGPNAYGMTASWGQVGGGQPDNTLINNGTVTTTGSNARAASILGQNGAITNTGTLMTTGNNSTAAYMQGNNDHLINSGVIRTTGIGSEGVFSNTAGAGFTATIENLAGGQIISDRGPAIRTLNGATSITNAGLLHGGNGFAINGGNGNIDLRLQTGSQIVGTADGGGGSNQVTLEGTGDLTNPFVNFQTLTMQGTDWTWSGTGGFADTFVESGILRLQSFLTGNAFVDLGATLEARAQTLPLNVTNDGLVRFAQPDAGTYTGQITGTGAVEKTGAGTLTLAPAAPGGNTYSGGTFLNAGVVAIGADNAIGAPGGGLTFNGGTLQFNDSFDLSAGRPIVLNPLGGTFDTQGFTSTITQGITGGGALTKAGSGALILNGNNTYAGGTTVAAGTLAVGDAANPGATLSGGGPIDVLSGGTLGGYGSVTGTVTNGGTIAAANAVSAFAGGPNGNFTINGDLFNSGLVQIGGSGVGNMLTVAGNYVGQNGIVALNTFLGSDGSPSDTFVISGAGNSASGSTGILIANTGGPGAFTTADGILVVEAVGGATTAPGSFSLAGPAGAGAREYLLFQGDLSGSDPDNWYLRSTIEAPPGAPPSPEPLPPPPAPPGTTLIQLIRPEVAVHSVVPSAALALTFLSVGTFHERQGEQALLHGDAGLGVWGRTFGQTTRESFAGGVLPSVSGISAGLQAGRDMLRFEGPSGHRNHVGLYVSHAHSVGDVRGFAIGVVDAPAGKVRLSATSLGAYWTHLGPAGGYVDTLVQASYVDGNPQSDRNVGAEVSGFGFTVSTEGGYPIPLTGGLTIEPQAQAIWQHLSLDDTADQLGTIRYGARDAFTGRLGARLRRTFDRVGGSWQTYLKANIWWASGGTDIVSFDADAIATARNGGASGEIGIGITGKLNRFFDIYAAASYLAAFKGERRESVKASIGARLVF